jgi:membrane-associated phospholipid phosphatase
MNAWTSFITRERNAWPTWWASLSLPRRYGAIAFFLLYWIALAALGDLRNDHFLIGCIAILLSIGGPAANTLLRFVLPLLLTGVVYDTTRYYPASWRPDVYVAFPYDFDLRFFGIDTPEGRLTPNEWWQKRTSPLLDLVTGFFYLFFIAIYVLICFYHAFILPLRSKDPVQRMKATRMAPYLTWGFFWVNLLGYSTYQWFPAAPPWYAELYGFGPADLSAPPSPAGALRFDELLGISVFSGMYSKSANVFGAIPSLHISYPCLTMLFAFHLGSARAFSLFFYLIMCFAAVYLNHHYIIDVIWGSAYAFIAFAAVKTYAIKKSERTLKTRL